MNLRFDTHVLIFGGAGSLGTALIKKYLADNQALRPGFQKTHLTVASRDEAKHWELRNLLQADHAQLSTVICDIRDPIRVREVLCQKKPTTVIIASALKQVDTCEYNPSESVETNILGVRNILRAINDMSSETAPLNLCFVSTDKAANPLNTYGMCKAISERLVLDNSLHNHNTKHVIVRYGNVINSKGSIVPLLMSQCKDPAVKHLTLTDDRMTRFMMTLDESVTLIQDAVRKGYSGQIWIPKLDSMKLVDLLSFFAEKFGKDVQKIGIRPGEKIHEILYSDTEALRLVKVDNRHCVIDQIAINNPIADGIEYSSKDHVVSSDVLRNRIEEFFERGSYARK